MITFKGPAEFEKMRHAGRVVAEVLAKVREAARPGVELASLDRLAAAIVAERGCLPSFLHYHGYPAHICLSPNETIVHGIPDGRRLREGDILSVDMGTIFEGWHGDAAVTSGSGRSPRRPGACWKPPNELCGRASSSAATGIAWAMWATPSGRSATAPVWA